MAVEINESSKRLFVSPCPPECHFQRETKIEPDLRLLPYKKWPLFSNFQVQRDSPCATKNGYLLCLNRRYIIHFQYSIRGFVILGANEVARMSFINAGGPKEAVSSLNRGTQRQ